MIISKMGARLKHGIIITLVAIFSSLALWMGAGMEKVYENFDGPYYLVVAKTWYVKSAIEGMFSFPLPTEYYAAHFPLYPALINLATYTGINHLQAMVIVNALATVVGANVLYGIALKKKWGNPLVIALAWLFLWPRMWAVRSVGSPETLFITLVILSLSFYENKNYFWAGIWGALATLTKSPGILLFGVYGILWTQDLIRTKKINWQAVPLVMIPAALVGLFYFFQMQTGDFWAYFNSGDNIHLQLMPFKVFDSNQPWVGNWWLEDVMWIYLVGAIGVVRAMKKSRVWGMWGAVFLTVIAFVSHRDIARYSLPLVPVVLLGFSEIWAKKEVRWALLLVLIPMYFYSLNFVLHNTMEIADWAALF